MWYMLVDLLPNALFKNEWLATLKVELLLSVGRIQVLRLWGQILQQASARKCVVNI